VLSYWSSMEGWAALDIRLSRCKGQEQEDGREPRNKSERWSNVTFDCSLRSFLLVTTRTCSEDNIMDEVESLDALAAILTELSENPYDLSLHAKHIALAQKHGLQDQLHVARDMLVGVYAGDEDIWTPMIEYCKSQEDLVTPYGVGRVLEMYTRAEEDYLCECSCITSPMRHS
jgi:hypothetical protein